MCNIASDWLCGLIKKKKKSIPVVDCVRDLGIIMDSKLNFREHISGIVRKANFAVSVLSRCFVTSDLPSLLHAYTVYARPLLEYASVVWSPFLDHRSLGCLGSLNRLESVESNFTRRSFWRCGLPNMPYKDRLELIGIDALELRV